MSQRGAVSIVGAAASKHLNYTIPITDDERIDINNGVKKIFVWAGADYVDAFGRRRTYALRATNQHQTVTQLGGYWALSASGEEGD